MKKVLIFGAYDTIHPGHLNFFRNARKLGELTIIVGRNETIKKIKGKLPKNNEKKRMKKLQKLNIAKNVILGGDKNPYKVIENEKPDIIALGYDQNNYTKDLKEELKKRNINVKIIRLKPYRKNIYKSSKLKWDYKRWKYPHLVY